MKTTLLIIALASAMIINAAAYSMPHDGIMYPHDTSTTPLVLESGVIESDITVTVQSDGQLILSGNWWEENIITPNTFDKVLTNTARPIGEQNTPEGYLFYFNTYRDGNPLGLYLVYNKDVNKWITMREAWSDIDRVIWKTYEYPGYDLLYKIGW